MSKYAIEFNPSALRQFKKLLPENWRLQLPLALADGERPNFEAPRALAQRPLG